MKRIVLILNYIRTHIWYLSRSSVAIFIFSVIKFTIKNAGQEQGNIN